MDLPGKIRTSMYALIIFYDVNKIAILNVHGKVYFLGLNDDLQISVNLSVKHRREL